MGELLLHSMNEFKSLFMRLFDILAPTRVCEIGSQQGEFSVAVLEWLEPRHGEFYCIEPFPSDLVKERADRTEAFHLVVGRSIDVLTAVPPCDIYFIDGEHNYFTVTTELTLIEQACAKHGRPWLAVLHDVGWPFGRRDGYYSTESYPEGTVREHDFWKGVTLDNPGVINGGFRSEGGFAFALHEGGARNGVLTAIEDFQRERDGLMYREIPLIFGVGFLFSSTAPFAEPLSTFLEPYDQLDLFKRVERNRLELYLRVLALQDELAEVRAQLQGKGVPPPDPVRVWW